MALRDIHHLLKTFWNGVRGWCDRQLPVDSTELSKLARARQLGTGRGTGITRRAAHRGAYGAQGARTPRHTCEGSVHLRHGPRNQPRGRVIRGDEASIHLLPGVHHAGVTLVEGRTKKLRSTAATGPVPKTLDSLQEQFAQGPCLDALGEYHTVRVDDFDPSNVGLTSWRLC